MCKFYQISSTICLKQSEAQTGAKQLGELIYYAPKVQSIRIQFVSPFHLEKVEIMSILWIYIPHLFSTIDAKLCQKHVFIFKSLQDYTQHQLGFGSL